MGPVNDWVKILQGLQAGEVDATHQMIALVTRYLQRIGAYQFRDSWEDLAQDVLMALLDSPPQSRESGSIVRHVQTTTYRRYVDEIRKERGRRRNPEEGGAGVQGWRINVSLDEAAELGGPEDFWANHLDPSVRSALDSLEPRKRDVVAARYLLGCTNDEGSERLEIPLGTYKRLLGQALKELQTILLLPAGSP